MNRELIKSYALIIKSRELLDVKKFIHQISFEKMESESFPNKFLSLFIFQGGGKGRSGSNVYGIKKFN